MSTASRAMSPPGDAPRATTLVTRLGVRLVVYGRGSSTEIFGKVKREPEHRTTCAEGTWCCCDTRQRTGWLSARSCFSHIAYAHSTAPSLYRQHLEGVHHPATQSVVRTDRRWSVASVLTLKEGDDLLGEAVHRLLRVGNPRERQEEVVEAKVELRLRLLTDLLGRTHERVLRVLLE
jgi:hypothetical protein